MTQWIGLGEYCHCKIKKKVTVQENLGHSARKRKARCGRCKKPKGSRNQSMTQWLFQSEFCVCPIDSKEDIVLCDATPTPTPTSMSADASSFFQDNSSKTLIISLFCLLIAIILAGTICLYFSSEPAQFLGQRKLNASRPALVLASLASELYSESITLDSSGFDAFEKRNYDSLSIALSHLSNEQLNRLAKLRGLKNLTLNGLTLKPEDIQQISHAKDLEFLEIDEASLGEEVCKELAKLPLQKLELNRCSVYADHLTPIICSQIPTVVLMMPLTESTVSELNEHRDKHNNAVYSLKTSQLKY